MTMRVAQAGIVLILCSCAGSQPPVDAGGPPVELAGRMAGAPRRCVMLNQLGSVRVSETDAHTLVFGSGKTIWTNHMGQCSLRRDDIVVTEPSGSQLCVGDVARSLDRNSGIAGPSCVLSDFVPYSR